MKPSASNTLIKGRISLSLFVLSLHSLFFHIFLFFIFSHLFFSFYSSLPYLKYYFLSFFLLIIFSSFILSASVAWKLFCIIKAHSLIPAYMHAYLHIIIWRCQNSCRKKSYGRRETVLCMQCAKQKINMI